jgi:hypothetical protein
MWRLWEKVDGSKATIGPVNQGLPVGHSSLPTSFHQIRIHQIFTITLFHRRRRHRHHQHHRHYKQQHHHQHHYHHHYHENHHHYHHHLYHDYHHHHHHHRLVISPIPPSSKTART